MNYITFKNLFVYYKRAIDMLLNFGMPSDSKLNDSIDKIFNIALENNFTEEGLSILYDCYYNMDFKEFISEDFWNNIIKKYLK